MEPPRSAAAPTAEQADLALVARLVIGDERALGELYDRLGSLAYALAFATLKDAADAEEIVGDTFAQVWRTARSFDATRGTLQAWVMTMVRSRALDRLRARRRNERLLSDESAPGVAEATAAFVAPAADADAETDEQRERVLEALRALTPAQQESLRLAYFEGLSQSEIAERLREPLGTVKSRMRAALQRLRAMLAPLRERGDL